MRMIETNKNWKKLSGKASEKEVDKYTLYKQYKEPSNKITIGRPLFKISPNEEFLSNLLLNRGNKTKANVVKTANNKR